MIFQETLKEFVVFVVVVSYMVFFYFVVSFLVGDRGLGRRNRRPVIDYMKFV